MGLATKTLDQAKKFFALPKEKKMEVHTDLLPTEFCGYHPMEQYNFHGAKYKGKVSIYSVVVFEMADGGKI